MTGDRCSHGFMLGGCPVCATQQVYVNPQMGWTCPKCGNVYSPSCPSCFKCNQPINPS